MTDDHVSPAQPRLRYRQSCVAVRFWVARAHQRCAGQFEPVPEPNASLPYFLLLEMPDGRVFENLSAAVRVVSEFEGKPLPLKLQLWMPRTFVCVEWLLGRLLIRRADLLLAPLHAASGYGLAGRAYLRAMGLIYAAAFAGALMQMPGLVGQHGLLPLQRFPVYGWSGFQADMAVWITSWLGLASALALTLRRWVCVASASAFCLYSLLISAGGDFFAYGFDYYILEAGFLAFLISAFARRGSPYCAAPQILVWYFWWLLLRLFLFPVLNQCAAGAMGDHTATQFRNDLMGQPLPTVLSWWLCQSPNWLINTVTSTTTALSMMAMLALVLGKRWRAIGGLLIVLLSVWAMLVSNGALSSWITIALALFCFEERWYRRGGLIPPPVVADSRSKPSAGLWLPGCAGAAAVVLWVLSLLYIARGYGWALPRAGQALLGASNHWRLMLPHVGMSRSVNKRLEVIVEGSRDGKDWKAYHFGWKPGSLRQAPRSASLHHPRLDWQMWFPFTSNDSYWLGAFVPSPPTQVGERYEWRPELFLLNLVDGIRRNESKIMELLASNPFPDVPPRLVRLRLYEYWFCSLEDHNKTGHWWSRRLMGTLDLQKKEIYPYRSPFEERLHRQLQRPVPPRS